MEDDDRYDNNDSSPSSSSSTSSLRYVTCGDPIVAESGCLMGHGTMSVNDRLVSSVSGFVDRVNKLVSVRPVQNRYGGEVGDVIVGRVVEVGDKKWKVDVGGRQHAVLQLSAVNLPGGVQRRRTVEDSLNMRTFFQENDLISAEVQKIHGDGSISLHTRNLKYGRLGNGTLISVPHNLIKRCKQHFQILSEEIQIEIILGLNGFIWIQEAPLVRPHLSQDPKQLAREEEEGIAPTYTPVTVEGRERVARVRNSIIALGKMGIVVFNATVSDVYLSSVQLGLPAKDMLSSPQIIIKITQTAVERTQA